MKRYHLRIYAYHAELEERDDGEWVKYEDVKKLADYLCPSCEKAIRERTGQPSEATDE